MLRLTSNTQLCREYRKFPLAVFIKCRIFHFKTEFTVIADTSLRIITLIIRLINVVLNDIMNINQLLIENLLSCLQSKAFVHLLTLLIVLCQFFAFALGGLLIILRIRLTL